MSRLRVRAAQHVIWTSHDEKVAIRRDALEVLLELAVAIKAFRDAHKTGAAAARIADYVDGLLGELDFGGPSDLAAVLDPAERLSKLAGSNGRQDTHNGRARRDDASPQRGDASTQAR